MNDTPLKLTHTHDTPGEGEPFDARLSPLLDEALKAPALPMGLTAEVFNQTRRKLPRPVLGVRFSFVALRRMQAIAAGIVLAAYVSVLLVGSGILRDARATAYAKQDIADLSDYQGPQTAIDQEIRQIATRIDAVSSFNTPLGLTEEEAAADDYSTLF